MIAELRRHGTKVPATKLEFVDSAGYLIPGYRGAVARVEESESVRDLTPDEYQSKDARSGREAPASVVGYPPASVVSGTFSSASSSSSASSALARAAQRTRTRRAAAASDDDEPHTAKARRTPPARKAATAPRKEASAVKEKSLCALKAQQVWNVGAEG